MAFISSNNHVVEKTNDTTQDSVVSAPILTESIPKYIICNGENINVDKKNCVNVSIAGLMNTGACCWWNSLIQVLLRCHSFNYYIKAVYSAPINQTNTKYELAVAYWKFLDKFSRTGNSRLHLNLFDVFSKVAASRQLSLDFHGQEGTANGLVVFLDCFDDPTVYRFFNNRYSVRIKCEKCNEINTMETPDKSIFIQLYKNVAQSLNPESMKQYFLRHIDYTDEFRCECGHHMEGRIERYTALKLIREIFIVVFDKQCVKNYPKEFEITSLDGTLHYSMFGQIEHYGNMLGGHYTATVMTDKGWFSCNDSQCLPAKSLNTNATHMVFYQLDDIKKTN